MFYRHHFWCITESNAVWRDIEKACFPCHRKFVWELYMCFIVRWMAIAMDERDLYCIAIYTACAVRNAWGNESSNTAKVLIRRLLPDFVWACYEFDGGRGKCGNVKGKCLLVWSRLEKQWLKCYLPLEWKVWRGGCYFSLPRTIHSREAKSFPTILDLA